ncbi:MAG: hypothetical protein WC595_06475 [Candidatus Nanoarchaeia archaeon]
MIDFIWGLKTTALFDVWSIEHILSGVSIGHAARNHNKKHFSILHSNIDHNHKTVVRFDIIAVLFIAYLWETLEHYLELGIAGAKVEYWFQGVEFFSNRFLTDPLLMVAGYLLAKKFPKYVLPARIVSIIWLLVHIFIFPDSMYLQRVLFGN